VIPNPLFLGRKSYFIGFSLRREIEKFIIIRQPPIGEKDDYDSENSWISDGLPSSSSFEFSEFYYTSNTPKIPSNTQDFTTPESAF